MASHDDTELQARLDFIARGRVVRRYHTCDMLDYQRIDGHSFGVAMLTTIIVPVASPLRRAALLMGGLVHDLAEHKTGDLPGPAKRELGLREQFGAYEDALLDRFGLMYPLDTRDARVVKLADAAEGAYHCTVERAKGNILAREAFKNFWSYLMELRLAPGHPGDPEIPEGLVIEDGERALRRWLATNWMEANGGKW